jgi:hypothetical protein
MAFVSIILTASDRGKLLRRALRSVFSQPFKDWELIVVADNPTDPEVLDTLNELRHSGSVIVTIVPFEACDPLLPTGGRSPLVKRVAVAVNQGLDLVKSEWITYLCDDDVYLPSRFELYLPYLKKADAVVGNANFVQENGAIWHQNKFRFQYPKPPLPGHEALLQDIRPNNFICHDSIVHRKTDLRWPTDVQPTPNDWRYWCALRQAGFLFHRIEGIGERATMPGMWRAGATQEGVLGLTGEEITGGNMRRVMYAKNITNKRQKVINTKNVSITVYPGERVDAADVSFVNAQGVTCLFAGFALCGDFSFPDVEGVETGAPLVSGRTQNLNRPKYSAPKQEQTVTQTKRRDPEREPPTVITRPRVFECEALQVPRSFEPIARIAGGTVLTTPNHEPKHPFDID